MNKVPVDIIWVKYKAPEVEKLSIASVLKHTTIPYHMTVYDNGPENRNLGILWNDLISRSDAEYICLLNTDAWPTEDGWLGKLLEVFDREKNVGVVGPLTNNCKNHQNKLEQTDTYHIIDYGKEYPGWCLSGFCMVFPKKVWEEVGRFAEDFGFYGQEVVFIDKVTKKYRQLIRTDVFIYHVGSHSAKKAEKAGELNEEREREIARDHFSKLRKDDLKNS